MYGTIRFVLDVWERYLGSAIPWHFAQDFNRLELVPVVEWNNAQCGYGFIETGFAGAGEMRSHPFCLDFDVLAHERCEESARPIGEFVGTHCRSVA